MKALVLRRFPEGYYLLPGTPKALAKLMRSRGEGPVLVHAAVVEAPPPPAVQAGDLDAVYLGELEARPEGAVPLEFLPREWGGSIREDGAYSALVEWETLAFLAERAGI